MCLIFRNPLSLLFVSLYLMSAVYSTENVLPPAQQKMTLEQWETFLNQYRSFPFEMKDFITSDIPKLPSKKRKNGQQVCLKETEYLKQRISNNITYSPEKSNFNGSPLYLTQEDIESDPSLPEVLKEQLLLSSKTIPIGYHILVPKNDIKGILIHVYGGGPTDQSKQTFHGVIKPDDAYNLQQGIMIVQLNLYDLLGVVPGLSQTEIPEMIHGIIHASINKVYTILKEAPALISEDLHLPDEALSKIFLTGTSFGARTVIRHAELYPDTFDGYIGREGIYSHGIFANHDYLSPTTSDNFDQKLAQITKPILLIHNFDDNRVPLEESFGLYDKLISIGKNVRLRIIPEGNPMPICGTLPLIMKGHFEPTEERSFDKFTKSISTFILGDIKEESAKERRKTFQYEIYGLKYKPNASFQDIFLSEAFRLYKASSQQLLPIDFERTWGVTFRPLFYTLKFVDDLRPKLTKHDLDNIIQDIIKDLNPDIKSSLLSTYNTFMKKEYGEDTTYNAVHGKKTIGENDYYFAFLKFAQLIIFKSHSDPQMKKLFSLRVFYDRTGYAKTNSEIDKAISLCQSDSTIVQNALKIQLLPLINYLKERYKGGVFDPFPVFKSFDFLVDDLNTFIDNKELQEAFINYINDGQLDWLKDVYLGNPELAEQYLVPTGQDTSDAIMAKEALLQLIQKDQRN